VPRPESPAAAGRSPEDFAAVLACGEPLFLVGGQAVNLWALYYHERTADLAPFVSRDMDVLGDRATLTRIATRAGAKPQFFPMRPPTNEVGVVMAKGADGQPLLIEVLAHLHGIGNDDLCQPAYTMAIGQSGVQVRLPGPIALLRAKIANVADLSQTGRQDGRHVRILAQLMPAYLADVQAAVAAGRLDERALLGLLERLLKAVTSAKARRVLGALSVGSRLLFREITAEPPSKVHAFVTRRLPRVLPE